MAKVTFWQPTDMAALPVSGAYESVSYSSGLPGVPAVYEVISQFEAGSFLLIGDDFALDIADLGAGTIRVAMIDTDDSGRFPNIQIEFPNGFPITMGLDLDDGDFFGALATLLRKGDTIKGSYGDDGIRGFDGKDKISGRKGNDTLTGDGGKDKFIFDTKPNADTNADFITDFKVNKDTIQLDQDIFKKIGDKLSAKEFRAGTKAKDGNDRIIYDDETGALYYDKNGENAGKKTVFAFLTTNLALDHKDFDMIG